MPGRRLAAWGSAVRRVLLSCRLGPTRLPGRSAVLALQSFGLDHYCLQAALWGVQQTEELLVKRRNLLEKKVDQETERAKEFTRQKNKRGELVTLLLPSSAPCKQSGVCCSLRFVVSMYMRAWQHGTHASSARAACMFSSEPCHGFVGHWNDSVASLHSSAFDSIAMCLVAQRRCKR